MSAPQLPGLEYDFGPQPTSPEAPDRSTWRGAEEDAQVFPQFARTTDPKILELWAKNKEAQQAWLKWVEALVDQATGTTKTRFFYGSAGAFDTRYLRGVDPQHISEQMNKHWKVRKADKPYRSWKKSHPLAKLLGSVSFSFPDFGGLPGMFIAHPYICSVVVFEHDGALWAGFSMDPAKAMSKWDVVWWPELSPWEPVKEWEYVKAKSEAQEARKKKETETKK